MKLIMGVIDSSYTEDGTTTGEVALILEEKYHPMTIFSELHEEEIADDMAEAMAGALESMMMGAPIGDPFAEGTSAITDRFKQFLATGEIEGTATPGIPTKASIKRRSLRFKSKKAEKARPSLIDTGLYMSSAITWVEGAPNANSE